MKLWMHYTLDRISAFASNNVHYLRVLFLNIFPCSAGGGKTRLLCINNVFQYAMNPKNVNKNMQSETLGKWRVSEFACMTISLHFGFVNEYIGIRTNPKFFLSTNSVLYNKPEDFGYSVTYAHRDQ